MSSDMTTDHLNMTLADISKERKKDGKGKQRGAKGAKRTPVKGRGTVQGNARNKARANTQRNRSANRSDVVAQRRGIVNTPAPSAKRGNARNTNRTVARNLARQAINRQQTRTRIQSTTVQSRRMNVARASPLKISLGAGNSRSIAGSRTGGGLNRRGGSGILGRLSTGSQRVSATTTKLRQARVNRAAILRPSSLFSRQNSLANRRNERTQQGSRSRNAVIDALRGISTSQPASNRNRGGRNNNNNNRGGNRHGSPSPAAGRQTLSAIFAATKKPYNNNNNNNNRNGGRNNNSNYNNNRGGGYNNNNNNNNSRPRLVLGSGNSGGNRGGNRRGGGRN